MKTLMTNLETLGFTKQTGLAGLSLNNVAVCMHWSGEEAMVYVDFLNGVCRHEPLFPMSQNVFTFLNGVCRHEHCCLNFSRQ